MMGKTHKLGGIIAGITFTKIFHTDMTGSLVIIAGALIGSTFPDIDNPNSRIRHRMPITSLLVSFGQNIIRKAASTLPQKQKQYVTSMIGHRGITHSFIGCTFLPVIAILIGLLLRFGILNALLAGLGIFIGCLSHLLLDMLSGGVPLFMPFSADKIYISEIQTGGRKEKMFRLCLAVVLIFSIMTI